MTYFVRSDDGPYDDMTGRELDAIRENMVRAANRGAVNDGSGCLFPGDHDPRHPTDMRFCVSMRDAQGARCEEWEELTEAEIAARYVAGATSAMMSSQFDFWWEA